MDVSAFFSSVSRVNVDVIGTLTCMSKLAFPGISFKFVNGSKIKILRPFRCMDRFEGS